MAFVQLKFLTDLLNVCAHHCQNKEQHFHFIGKWEDSFACLKSYLQFHSFWYLRTSPKHTCELATILPQICGNQA